MRSIPDFHLLASIGLLAELLFWYFNLIFLLTSYSARSEFKKAQKFSKLASVKVRKFQLLLCATAITHPTLLSFPYFISCIVLITLLCFGEGTNRCLAWRRFCLRLARVARFMRVFYVAVHLLLVYSYQIPFVQTIISDQVAQCVFDYFCLEFIRFLLL